MNRTDALHRWWTALAVGAAVALVAIVVEGLRAAAQGDYDDLLLVLVALLLWFRLAAKAWHRARTTATRG